MQDNEITGAIVDVAYKIHTKLGAGLFESVYERVMAYEFKQRGLKFERQKPIPVTNLIKNGIDRIINNKQTLIPILYNNALN